MKINQKADIARRSATKEAMDMPAIMPDANAVWELLPDGDGTDVCGMVGPVGLPRAPVSFFGFGWGAPDVKFAGPHGVFAKIL
jgi:hypothetical protein